mmetsp:Transcript_38088/g.73027  ORF Transcript_38088/g.73027 Transcript_38088/m.73027 type:complete len:272 (+) Transcript_38088:356-1171(+)
MCMSLEWSGKRIHHLRTHLHQAEHLLQVFEADARLARQVQALEIQQEVARGQGGDAPRQGAAQHLQNLLGPERAAVAGGESPIQVLENLLVGLHGAGQGPERLRQLRLAPGANVHREVDAVAHGAHQVVVAHQRLPRRVQQRAQVAQLRLLRLQLEHLAHEVHDLPALQGPQTIFVESFEELFELGLIPFQDGVHGEQDLFNGLVRREFTGARFYAPQELWPVVVARVLVHLAGMAIYQQRAPSGLHHFQHPLLFPARHAYVPPFPRCSSL